MKKAVIGVTPLWDRDRDSCWMLPGYLEGLELAGALPITLSLTEDAGGISQLVSLCDGCDGFLFTGGQDVSPELYGEKPCVTCGEICAKRDTFEQRLFTQVLEQDKPMLGICRGIQFFNACLGGTLYQDLPTEHPSEVAHVMHPPYDREVHSVAILPETPLVALLGQNWASTATTTRRSGCWPPALRRWPAVRMDWWRRCICRTRPLCGRCSGTRSFPSAPMKTAGRFSPRLLRQPLIREADYKKFKVRQKGKACSIYRSFPGLEVSFETVKGFNGDSQY